MKNFNYTSIAILGYLMYGRAVDEEITFNIMNKNLTLLSWVIVFHLVLELKKRIHLLGL